MSWWLLFIAIGLATLTLRTFFLMLDGTSVSGRFEDFRRFVPVAALTALIVPSLLPRDGEPLGARSLAALFAAAVAWRTQNVLLTVAVGLGLFWLIGWAVA